MSVGVSGWGFRVGFQVSSLGFKIYGFGIGVLCIGFEVTRSRAEGSGLRVWDLGFRVSGVGFRIWGLEFGIVVWGLEIGVWGFGFRVAGVGFNVQTRQLRSKNVRFRGRLVFKAHRLCVSLNSRLESNKEEEELGGARVWVLGLGFGDRIRSARGLQGFLAHKKTPPPRTLL